MSVVGKVKEAGKKKASLPVNCVQSITDTDKVKNRFYRSDERREKKMDLNDTER